MTNVQQTIQNVIQQMNSQPMTLVKTPPKPIFIIRVPARLSNSEMAEIRKTIAKDNINNDYHVMIIPSNVDDFMFEMYNADKIDVQQWNSIVTKLTK
jgi:hypothetical protein